MDATPRKKRIRFTNTEGNAPLTTVYGVSPNKSWKVNAGTIKQRRLHERYPEYAPEENREIYSMTVPETNENAIKQAKELELSLLQDEVRGLLERVRFPPIFMEPVLESPSKMRKLLRILEEVRANTTIPESSKEIETIYRFSKQANMAGGKRRARTRRKRMN